MRVSTSTLAKRRVEQLGDAEVEQLGFAVGGDEDVAGLEVAMDDEVGVGVLYCGAHLAEDFEAASDGDPFFVAVFIERLAVDVLHDEVGLALWRFGDLIQPCDVGMVECGEQLAFELETAKDVVCVESLADELDGDYALGAVFAVVGCFVDGPHPAASDAAQHAVGADHLGVGVCRAVGGGGAVKGLAQNVAAALSRLAWQCWGVVLVKITVSHLKHLFRSVGSYSNAAAGGSTVRAPG